MMEILDHFDPKVRQLKNSDNLKWLLAGIICFGFFIQLESFFQQIHFWFFKDPILDLICPMGQPAPFRNKSEGVNLIGFLGIIISLFILKNRQWKVSKLSKVRFLLISPFLLLLIQYILGEIVWRFL